MWTAASGLAGGRWRRQHKIELGGDEWSVAYAPLGATRHKSSKSLLRVSAVILVKFKLAKNKWKPWLRIKKPTVITYLSKYNKHYSVFVYVVICYNIHANLYLYVVTTLWQKFSMLKIFHITLSSSGQISHLISGKIRFRLDSKKQNPVHPYKTQRWCWGCWVYDMWLTPPPWLW